MTTNKGANRTFLITTIVYIGFSFFWGFVGSLLKIPFWVDVLMSQLTVFLPAFIYIKIAGMKVRELIPYRKIRISDALLAVLMTYLFYPLMVVMNLITMFFVDNTTAQMTGSLQEQGIFLNMLLIAVIPACVEEFVFRGMLYHTYKKSGFLKGILLSAFLFGCMHMNFNQFLYTFVFGIILALAVEATGSILTSMICHFILNLNSVLMVGILSRRNGALDQALEGNASLMDDPKMLLAGTISWLVIAFFATAGAVGIWVCLAKRNGRLEYIQEKIKEPSAGRIFTVPLAIGVLIAFGLMLVIEIF